MRKFSFHSSDTFWPAQKRSCHKLVCPGQFQNLAEFLLPFSLEVFGMIEEIICLSKIGKKLLFFFSIDILKKNIQNIHWICPNIQLIYLLLIYFLFLLVKIKTVQRTCQFSCFHYTSTCHCETYPIDFISLSEVLHCESYSI